MLHQGTVAASDENRRGGDITSRFLPERHLKLVLYTTQRFLPTLYTGWKNAFFSKKISISKKMCIFAFGMIQEL
jgi:hypothetical protein